ncbi:MAG: hypothetical protein H6Q37_2631, partial [Chloroflexi bacterium]|nr:hypothetical protein [Chloroflexota bacterium]
MLAGLAFAVPAIQRRLAWRADMAYTYVRVALSDAGPLPTALPQPQIAVTHQPTATNDPSVMPEPTISPTAGPTPTSTPVPTPIPASVALTPPKWEKQDANNCGPASLALHLRHYGWEGDQYTISDVIKPFREDRNVNVDELVYFVRNKAGWLNIEYRVGGTIDTLKS